MGRLFEMTYQHRHLHNGPVVAYIISMITHHHRRRLSIASPDGRAAATALRRVVQPLQRREERPTAALRSGGGLPFEHVMGLRGQHQVHPSGIGHSEEAMEKVGCARPRLLQARGSQLQPTVVDAKTLRARNRTRGHRDSSSRSAATAPISWTSARRAERNHRPDRARTIMWPRLSGARLAPAGEPGPRIE